MAIFGLHANRLWISLRFKLNVHGTRRASGEFPRAECVRRHPADDVGEEQRRGELILQARTHGIETKHDDFRRTGPSNDERASVGARDSDVTRTGAEGLGASEFDIASPQTGS